MSGPVIVLDQLQKNYGSFVAVNRISMSVPTGEIFGFLGANGAGKTTTIRMLCGLARPTAGHGFIGDEDVWKNRAHVRSKFGYVAQKFSLYPDLTVLENLRFFGGACRVPHDVLGKRIEVLLKQMDLVDKRRARAGSLSGGVKQLLALACALVHEPQLLFLDEPTSGLDPVHRQQLWSLLYDLSNGGTTIFVTTHYMDEAERCTEVGFLDKGRLLAKESPLTLKKSFRGRLLEMEIEPVMPALVQLRAAPGVLDATLRSGLVRLYAADPEKLLADWQKKWPWPELKWIGHRWADADMEDVFKAYSQGYFDILHAKPEPA
jgi:ABC-2 type transport system ATP-binding protein